MIRRPPRSAVVAYTTLFRSQPRGSGDAVRAHCQQRRTARLYADRVRAVVLLTRADLRQAGPRSEEHTSELQSHLNLVCRLLLQIKNAHQYLLRLKSRSATLP